MRNSYRIDPQERIVHLIWQQGNIFEEWEELLEAVFTDPAFVTGFNFLSDRRAALSSAPSKDYADRALAYFQRHSALFGRCKVAILSADLITYSTSRTTSIRADLASMTVEIQGFDNYEKARRWLLR